MQCKWILLPITLLLLLALGCEKTRESLAERAGGLIDSTRHTLDVRSNVTDLHENHYDAFVNQRDKLVVVTFTADWCGPCRQLAPAMERVTSEFGDQVSAGRVDVDQARSLAAKSGVSGIPDVRFFHNGRQVHQFTGARNRDQLREVFQEHFDAMEEGTLGESTIIPEIQPLARELREVSRDLRTTPPPPEPSEDAADGNEEETAQPVIRRMEKDWMPPGIERR